MAARTRRTSLNDSWKEKIKMTQIINRIQDCAMGDIEMTPVQMKAAEILLKKMIPDLKAIDLNATHEAVDKAEMLKMLAESLPK